MSTEIFTLDGIFCTWDDDMLAASGQLKLWYSNEAKLTWRSLRRLAKFMDTLELSLFC